MCLQSLLALQVFEFCIFVFSEHFLLICIFDVMLDLSYTFWQICKYQNNVCESSVLGTKSIIHTPLLSVS